MLVLIAGAAICLPAIVPLAAVSKLAPRCGPVGGTTLVEGPRARVYSLPGSEPRGVDRVLGCVPSASHSWKLSPLGPSRFGGYQLGKRILLSGVWAGGLLRSHGIDTYQLWVRSTNLRTGKVIRCGWVRRGAEERRVAIGPGSRRKRKSGLERRTMGVGARGRSSVRKRFAGIVSPCDVSSRRAKAGCRMWWDGGSRTRQR